VLLGVLLVTRLVVREGPMAKVWRLLLLPLLRDGR
jgi:hypothetical protein